MLVFIATALSQAEDRLPEIEILRPGVRLSVVAEHPDIATPTGVDVDKNGRIWTVACHTHMPPKDYDGPALEKEVLDFWREHDVFQKSLDRTAGNPLFTFNDKTLSPKTEKPRAHRLHPGRKLRGTTRLYGKTRRL